MDDIKEQQRYTDQIFNYMSASRQHLKSGEFALLTYSSDGVNVALHSAAVPRKTITTTVIIGPNGCGKSRLLGNIVDELTLIQQLKLSQNEGTFPTHFLSPISKQANIEYVVAGIRYSISRSGRDLSATSEGRTISVQQVPFPAKVIAVAHLPVDRFRFARSEADSFYSYCGLRQATNLTTTRALEYKVILAFLKGSGRNKYIEKMGDWLKILNLAGPATLRLVGLSSRIFKAQTLDEFRKNMEEMPTRAGSFEPQLSVMHPEYGDDIESAWTFLESIRRNLFQNLDSRNSHDIEINDLNIASTPVDLWIAGIEAIRRLRLIRTTFLAFKRNGNLVDFSALSSGEQQVLGTVSRLLAEIEPNTVVLIDEPEVSLHPSWQVRYLPTLISTLKDFPATHVVIATHSHFLVSDVSAKSATLLVGSEDAPLNFQEFEGDVYGRSPENILYRVFGIGATGNYQVERDLGTALQMISGTVDLNRNQLYSIFRRLKKVEDQNNDAFSIILKEVGQFIDQLK